MAQQPANQTYNQVLPTLPDFAQGFEEGMQAFKDGVFFPEHNKVWTEEDIIKLVETELSGTRYQRDTRLNAAFNITHLSYLHHVGFVVGYIHEALAQ